MGLPRIREGSLSYGFFGVPERHAGRISSSSRFPPQLARARREPDEPRKVPPARFADPPSVVLIDAIIAGRCPSRGIALHGNAPLR